MCKPMGQIILFVLQSFTFGTAEGRNCFQVLLVLNGGTFEYEIELYLGCNSNKKGILMHNWGVGLEKRLV